jgi:hypothetical protein
MIATAGRTRNGVSTVIVKPQANPSFPSIDPDRFDRQATGSHASPTNVDPMDLDSSAVDASRIGRTPRPTNAPRPVDKTEFAINPFTVIVDTREQAAWSFRGIMTDGGPREPRRPLVVPTLVATLQTADYSIHGFEDRIVIERKSLADLYGTLGGGRERFERELVRMQAIASHPEGGFAAVVVEASWEGILFRPPEGMRMTPKSVYRSILAWQQRPGTNRIQWLLCDTRDIAEHMAFRHLERFWTDEQEKLKRAERERKAATKKQAVQQQKTLNGV